MTFKFSLPKLKTIKTLSFVLKALRSFGHKLEPSAKCSMKNRTWKHQAGQPSNIPLMYNLTLWNNFLIKKALTFYY